MDRCEFVLAEEVEVESYMHAVVPLQALLLHGRPLVGGRCLFSNVSLYDWFNATAEVTFDATTLGAEFHAELSVSFPWRWRNSLRFPTTKSPARGPAFPEVAVRSLGTHKRAILAALLVRFKACAGQTPETST